MKIRCLLSFTLTLAALALSRTSRADSLAERVPADAIAYAEWQGTATLGKSYENSHLKQLLDVLNIPQLLSQKMQEDLDKKAADPDKQGDARLLQDCLAIAIKSQTAVYIGPMDFSDPQDPNPHLAIISRIGPAAAADFARRLDASLERHKRVKKAAAIAVGDYLLISIGAETDISKRLAGAILPENLAALPAFKETLAQVDALTTPPATLVYINGEEAVKLLDEALAAKGGPIAHQVWPKLQELFHPEGLHQIVWAGNFDAAGNWIDQAFIGLSANRVGISAFLDNKPLTEDAFKLIPKSASFAAIMRLDFQRFFDDLHDFAVNSDPNGAAGWDMGMKQFFAFTGVQLKTDLIDPLDDTFAVYSAPDAGGNSLKSATLATRLKDGPKFDTALSTLESTIMAMVSARSPDSKFIIKTEPLPAPNDKITAHIMTAGNFSPTWATSGDILYLGATTAAIQAAITDAGKKGTILENPRFSELLQKLGQKQISAFSYENLPDLAPEIHAALQKLIAQKHEHVAQPPSAVINPDEKNPFVLPPVEKIGPILSPALAITWTDKDGFHLRTIGPFPFAGNLARQILIQTLLPPRPSGKIQDTPAEPPMP